MAKSIPSKKMEGFFSTTQIRKAAGLTTNQAVFNRAKARGGIQPTYHMGTAVLWDQKAYDILIVSYGRGRAAAQHRRAIALTELKPRKRRRTRAAQ